MILQKVILKRSGFKFKKHVTKIKVATSVATEQNLILCIRVSDPTF